MSPRTFLTTGLLILALVLGATIPTLAQEGLTITHALGTTEITRKPERIVVFDFGVLDSLDQLGVDVIGVPHSSLPPYLSKYADSRYKHVGSLKEPDFEAIYTLRPDLIIISGRQSLHYDELSKIAPTIFMGIDTANYWDSFKQNMITLGEIFGAENEVAQELAAIESSITQLRAATSGQTALMLLVTGGRANAYGPGSRYGFVYDVLGLTPADATIAGTTHGQNISWEFVLEKDPDHLLVIDRDAVVAGEGAQTAKQVVENALVKHTKAYQTGRITYLDPYYWYLSGGGLVSFTMMLNEIENAIQ